MPPSSSTAVSMIFWQVASSRMSPGHRIGLAARRLDQAHGLGGVGFLALQVAEHHVGALPGEGQGDGSADAGVGAGDHGPLAGQPVASAVGVLAVVRLVLHLLGEPGMGLLLIGVGLLVLLGGIWRQACGSNYRCHPGRLPGSAGGCSGHSCQEASSGPRDSSSNSRCWSR